MEENTSTLDIRAINEKIERESAFIDLLTLEMNKVIIGQKHMVERLLIGLLGQGHILLEGVPGLAKTRLASAAPWGATTQRALAKAAMHLLRGREPASITANPRCRRACSRPSS